MAATGHCLCGNISFEYDGEVGAAGYCHCEDCRRVTGSAFNIGVRFELASFRIVRGTPKGFSKFADSGNELTRYFCGDCGSPLYTASPKHPDIIHVKAGVIDDAALVQPTDQAWLSSSVAWAYIDPALKRHDRGR